MNFNSKDYSKKKFWKFNSKIDSKFEFACIQFNEIFIQLEKPGIVYPSNTEDLMGPLMAHMAYMPIYIGEMWDVTSASGRRDAGTLRKWKLKQTTF